MCLCTLIDPGMKSNIGRMTSFERFDYFGVMYFFED